ncbi:hypothetical protein L1987_79568 [Smallanthus sonchifolius]|uniref:Uncharacterized protein n=1 Tax=Smallanthus sonchifolius TaxID=185202 RepID=A0ACB8ZK84_9ASTR|nr:hypothetical protein L1987_79568 [Smallanthus sonchifolius]
MFCPTAALIGKVKNIRYEEKDVSMVMLGQLVEFTTAEGEWDETDFKGGMCLRFISVIADVGAKVSEILHRVDNQNGKSLEKNSKVLKGVQATREEPSTSSASASKGKAKSKAKGKSKRRSDGILSISNGYESSDESSGSFALTSVAGKAGP